MIYSLFEFGKTIALGFLLNDYFRRNYPSQYRDIGIDVLFNTIYIYSWCEMLFKNSFQYIENNNPQAVNFIRKFFKATPKKLDIEFIKDNQIVNKHSKQQYLNSEGVAVIPEYDIVLYSDTSETQNNIKIMHPTCKWCLLNAETYEYELSTIKFILLEFIVGEKSYKIDLATNKYNFYVRGNILDKNFFLYYLRHIHKDELIFEEDDIQLDEITIKIIDHNVNIKKISLTENATQCIKIDTSGYEIINKPL